MTSWYENDGVRNRTIELLKKTGTPLEIYVSSLLQKVQNNMMKTFDESYDGFFIDVYSRYVYNYKDSEDNVREVDHFIDLYNIIEIDKIQFSVKINIAIECKHREGMKLIGFPVLEGIDDIYAPILGNIYKSGTFGLIDTFKDILKDIKLVYTSAIKFKNNGTPIEIIDENIIYKAGTSLYDFMPHILDKRFSEKFEKRALEVDEQENYGLNSALAEDEGQYTNFSFFKADDYLKVYIDVAKKLRPEIIVFIPIICVDSDLTLAHLNSDSTDVDRFLDVNFMISEISFSKWSIGIKNIMNTSKNSPHVLIVDREGIKRFIQTIPIWSLRIHGLLSNLLSREFNTLASNYGRRLLE